MADYANDYGTQEEHGAFSDSIANAKPMDVDALRLVLEAAKEYANFVSIKYMGELENKAKEEKEKTEGAIAKLSALI